MTKVIRLTENDVERLVKKILKEEFDPYLVDTLETIFNPLTVGDDFEVEVHGVGEECYVDIMGYGDWHQVYPYIEEASQFASSIGGRLGNIILSDEDMGDEVVRKTINAARQYSNRKDVTSIRVWFDGL
jgi:hypothetical protein